MRHVAPEWQRLTAEAYDLVAAGDIEGARAVLEDGLGGADLDANEPRADFAAATSVYARVLLAGGDAPRARDWAAYSRGLVSDMYGPADPRTVRAAATLAAAAHRTGDLAEAEGLYRDVVARLSEQDGPDSARTLAARADLAIVLHARGQCGAGRAELEFAHAAFRQAYGPGEPAGVRMLARLGAMARDCGDTAAAARLFTQARAACREHLPPYHPVAGQVADLAATPPDPAHTCGSDEDDLGWWPPETAAPAPRHHHGPDAGRLPTHAAMPPHPAAPDPGHPHPPDPGRLPPHPAVAEPRHLPTQTAAPQHPRGADPGRLPSHTAAPPHPAVAGPRHLSTQTAAAQHPAVAAPGRLPSHTAAPPHPAVADAQATASPRPAAPTAPVQARQPSAPGPADVGHPSRRDGAGGRRRALALGAGLAALGLAGGFLAVNAALHRKPAADHPPASVSADAPVSAAAPTAVELRDQRDSVTLTWTYPGGAEGPVLVSGGRTGQPARALATLPAGATSYTLHALAERSDYCFTVAVAYSTDTVARADPVCTARALSSPGR